MKRPKDMTLEELRSLPTGPIGMKYIDLPHPDYPGCTGKKLAIPYLMDVICSNYSEDDLLGAVIDNESYTFGQFRDKSWFKERVHF